MKFTLICEYDDGDYKDYSRTEHQFNAEFIDDVVAGVEQFLMGAGFTWLKPGEIQFNRQAEESTGCGGCGGCGGCDRGN